MKQLMILLFLVFLGACKSEGVNVQRSTPAAGFGSETSSEEESVAAEIAEELEIELIKEEDSKGVKFSVKEGFCLNDQGEKVLIETEELKNCASLADRNLEEIDFLKKKLKYYGANLKGSDLSKNKLSYYKLVWYEDQIDENTLFPHSGKKLNKVLGKSHNNASKAIVKQNQKRLKNINVIIEKNRSLKAEFLDSQTTKARKRKIIRLMKKNKKKITKLETLINDYNRKGTRHKAGAKVYLVKSN